MDVFEKNRIGTLKGETIAGNLIAGKVIAEIKRFCFMHDLGLELHTTPLYLQTHILFKITGDEKYLNAIQDAMKNWGVDK